jgi:hypothetical protein
VIVLALVGGLIVSALLNTFMFLYYRRARQWDASIGLAYDPKLVQTPSPQPYLQTIDYSQPSTPFISPPPAEFGKLALKSARFQR